MQIIDITVRQLSRLRDALRTLGDTWGTTEPERDEPYPVDQVVPDADQWLFRGVDVDAPVATTFRWLCQLRAAPYSYDWIDNGGRRSPQDLTPGLEHVEPGQRAMAMFRVANVEPGRSITLHAPRSVFGEVGVTYRAVDTTPGRSRIVVKLGTVYPRGLHGEIMRDLLPFGDLVMMRKQLQTLASLAGARRGGGPRMSGCYARPNCPSN